MTELPRGQSEIVCDLEILGAGEFSNQLHLFVADPGTREIIFRVHGQAKAAEPAASKGP